MIESVIQLKCGCNNYPWGKVGRDSLAAQLCSQIPGTDFSIDGRTNYAEMWMGTYPVTPSYVLATGENLQDVLNSNKEKLIGPKVLDKFGSELPFLPKILSIQKALPLQIHPDIELSKRLHEKNPEKFSDANHKPEIAIALTDFEAFCGFKPKADIQQLLALAPLKQFNMNKSEWSDNTLRRVCKSMLEASENTVASTIRALGDTSRKLLGEQAYMLDLIPRLVNQYGAADNGSLVALILMNYFTFKPGEAIWIPADGIHAYLHGDIVECMARSDNVLNTGFCPRADRDSIDTFVNALTFKQHDREKPLLPRSVTEHSNTGKTTAFKPPMSEFNMLVTELQPGEKDDIKSLNGPSIMFVTSGQGKMKVNDEQHEIKPGSIYFIGQGVDMSLESSSSADFAAYRAYTE